MRKYRPNCRRNNLTPRRRNKVTLDTGGAGYSRLLLLRFFPLQTM